MFRILVRLGFVILLLLLASAVPLVAQQTELTLEELASRVRALIISQEDTLGRVIALETAVASLGEEVLAPTKVVTNGNVNIRRGPGTEYEIIGTARKGDVFTLIDNESELTWWEVEFGEGSGWIHAYYVDMIGVSDAAASETPNPSIAPVVEQKPTPTPTDIPYGASHKEWAQMATLVGRDMVGRGVEKGYLTPEELRDVINTYLQTAMEAAEDCELTTIELMGFVDVYAEMVDDAGVSEKLNISSRWDLLSALVDRRIPGFNCEENIQLRAQWIIDEYGD